MLTKEQVQKIISENELLQIQLADLNEILELRNEEIEILRGKSRRAVELQSTLENNLEEFTYMQHVIGKHQQKERKQEKVGAEMESELLESIRMEKEYYHIKDKFSSSTAALADLHQQLNEMPALNAELEQCRRKIAELESKLDLLEEENELYRYEAAKWKKKFEEQVR